MTQAVSVIDHDISWNNAGLAYKAVRIRVRNTASAAGAKILDFEVDGASVFSVGKAGDVVLSVADSGIDVVGTEAIRLKAPTGYALRLHGGGFDGWDVNPHLVPRVTFAFSIGNYTELVHNFYLGGSIKGSLIVPLTESVATPVYSIVIPAGEHVGGEFYYSIYCSDGTDHQLFTSSIRFSAINKAGTVTNALLPAAPDQTNDGNAGVVSAGTFAYAITCVNTATGIDFKINTASSLVQTILQAEVHIRMLRAQLTSPE